MMMNRITCHFCPTTVLDVDAAIAAGWEPGFWDDEIGHDHSHPVCPECVGRRLIWSDVVHDYEIRQDVAEPVVVG